MAYIKGRAEPAYSVVSRCGGVIRTAKLLGVTPGAVSRWMTYGEHGTNGRVPEVYHAALMRWSDRVEAGLTREGLAGSVALP